MVVRRLRSALQVEVTRGAHSSELRRDARAEQSSRLRNQRTCNGAPLRLERHIIRRASATGARVPVTRVTGVTLLAMQIRVHPRSIATVIFLRTPMRRLPVAARVMPQSLDR